MKNANSTSVRHVRQGNREGILPIFTVHEHGQMPDDETTSPIPERPGSGDKKRGGRTLTKG